MIPGARILTLISLTLILALDVSAQCCPSQEDETEYYGTAKIEIDQPQIWTGERFVNGSLIVDDDLRLIDCDLVISGEGIVIKENGSLSMEDSTLSPQDPGIGYYIDSFGSLSISGSRIKDCLDPANGYVGIYIEGGSFRMDDSEMIRSGLIRTDVDGTIIRDSTISGLASVEADSEVSGSLIDGVGLSMAGDGNLTVINTDITSNISYSGSISGISCEGGDLTVDSVNINGTFGGGILCVGSRARIGSATLELNTSGYGIRAVDCDLLHVNGSSVEGAYGGLEVEDTVERIYLRNISVSRGHHGLSLAGPLPVTMFNISVSSTTYGIISFSPMDMENVNILDVDVGIRLEEEWDLLSTDCTVKNFSLWGLEVKTWEIMDNTGIELIPGEGHLSNMTMWGDIRIEAIGPMGGPIDTERLRISSSIGGETEINPGTVGLIWGYLSSDGDPVMIKYRVNGSWGNARSSEEFFVEEGESIILELPIADIFVRSLQMKDGSAVVEVGTSNSEAKGVTVTCYIDGTYRFDQKVNLIPEEIITLELPLGPVEEGEHELTCTVSSDDEYSNANSRLLSNNRMSVFVEKSEHNDDRGREFAIIVILTIAVVMILVTIIFRRRG